MFVNFSESTEFLASPHIARETQVDNNTVYRVNEALRVQMTKTRIGFAVDNNVCHNCRGTRGPMERLLVKRGVAQSSSAPRTVLCLYDTHIAPRHIDLAKCIVLTCVPYALSCHIRHQETNMHSTVFRDTKTTDILNSYLQLSSNFEVNVKRLNDTWKRSNSH